MTSYLEALRQAAILFPIIAVAFTIPYIAFNYHKYGSILSLRAVIVYTFILYLLCVYCLVILPLPSPEAAAQLHGHKAQLVPFAFVGDILRNCDFQWSRPETWLSVLGTSAFLTTAFNLLMTMPFGVYLRYYFQCRWFKTLALSFLLSLFFEVTQLTGLYFLYPGSYRLFDVDDLMVNTLGGMIGYLLGGLAARFLPSRNEIDRASFVRGHQVSFLRRLVALVYDAVAAAALSGVLILALAALSLPVHIASAGLLAMVYFMFVPVLSRGQTMGHRLTRLRVVTAEGERSRWYQYILRYGSLFAVLYWLPWLLNLAIIFLRDQGILNDLTALVAGGALVGGYLFCLLFEAVRMAVHKPLFYERLSRTRIESTIEAGTPASPS